MLIDAQRKSEGSGPRKSPKIELLPKRTKILHLVECLNVVMRQLAFLILPSRPMFKRNAPKRGQDLRMLLAQVRDQDHVVLV